MTWAEANMWIELVKPVAEKYFVVEIFYRNIEHFSYLEFFEQIHVPHPYKKQLATARISVGKIIVRDNREDIYTWERRARPQRAGYATKAWQIEKSLCDPAFDPTSIIIEIEKELARIRLKTKKE
jgi:hypothetical protein